MKSSNFVARIISGLIIFSFFGVLFWAAERVFPITPTEATSAIVATDAIKSAPGAVERVRVFPDGNAQVKIFFPELRDSNKDGFVVLTINGFRTGINVAKKDGEYYYAEFKYPFVVDCTEHLVHIRAEYSKEIKTENDILVEPVGCEKSTLHVSGLSDGKTLWISFPELSVVLDGGTSVDSVIINGVEQGKSPVMIDGKTWYVAAKNPYATYACGSDEIRFEAKKGTTVTMGKAFISYEFCPRQP